MVDAQTRARHKVELLESIRALSDQSQTMAMGSQIVSAGVVAREIEEETAQGKRWLQAYIELVESPDKYQ